MNTHYMPNYDHEITITWRDLETALRMLSAPGKLPYLDDSLQMVQTLARTAGPEKAVFNLITTIAWLTDELAPTGSLDG